MTIEDIKAANKAAGKKFFDPSQVHQWKSRISSRVHEGPGGIFFVTSEPGYDDVRRWSVRQFIPENGSIKTTAWSKYGSDSRAQSDAAKFAREGLGTGQEAA